MGGKGGGRGKKRRSPISGTGDSGKTKFGRTTWRSANASEIVDPRFPQSCPRLSPFADLLTVHDFRCCPAVKPMRTFQLPAAPRGFIRLTNVGRKHNGNDRLVISAWDVCGCHTPRFFLGCQLSPNHFVRSFTTFRLDGAARFPLRAWRIVASEDVIVLSCCQW
jgi:hypothetical protein